MNVVRLGEIVEYNNSKIHTNELTSENYISTENMIPNAEGITLSSSIPYNTTVTRFDVGNILLSNIRPYFKKVFYPLFNGGCSNDVLCFSVIDQRVINSKYIYYLMTTDKFIDYVVASSNGAKMPRGSKDAILNFEFSLHDQTAQQHIIDIICCLICLLFC